MNEEKSCGLCHEDAKTPLLRHCHRLEVEMKMLESPCILSEETQREMVDMVLEQTKTLIDFIKDAIK